LTVLQRSDEALAFMREKVEEFPENRRLRLILARSLFERNDLVAAQSEYTYVLTKAPNDGDVLFALALIALQQGNDAEAKRFFERMVRWDQRAGEANYYLGSIAERESDQAAALRAYRQVGDGYEFLPAQARIAALLADDGQWEEAREHLHRARTQHPDQFQQLAMIEAQLLADRGMGSEALEFLDGVLLEDPDNIDLLYFRAMTGQRFGRLDVLERDLRNVIELDPANADAMNALGYTLTDLTHRHEEALILIEQALAIKPDEAAFIDSMGWVQYRLNNYEAAIVHLRRALSLFQNDEVAAHLGEVLWVIGEKAEAQEVWNRALELAPESEILKTVIQRFRDQ
jgi:tetratricopeptide (TPR) repeat protein